jgi:hypothetical protein
MAFSSLLIGLIVGAQVVSVQVSAPLAPAEVVFSVDGREAARAAGAPWSASVDFGFELRPHELVARALDGGGKEIARVARWINTPQPPARLEILIERDGEGRPRAARLVATSVRREAPLRQRLKLDGSALAFDESGRAVLHGLDMSRVHVLSAVADFSGDAIARTDVAFGGDVGEAAASQLTAVPVRLRGPREPTPEQTAQALRGPGGPIAPVALERGDSTVLFVRDPINSEAGRRLGRPNRDYPVPFDGGDHVGFVWPVARPGAHGPVESELFESMGPFGERDRGYHWMLSRLSRIGKPVPGPYRYADAVAVAGLQAAGASTRREVVLVEGEDRRDGSVFSPEQVEGYLRSLGVPLRVWSLTPAGATRWRDGQVEDVSSLFKLSIAVDRLKRDLSSQRIAWVSGSWAPGQITVAPGDPVVSALR